MSADPPRSLSNALSQPVEVGGVGVPTWLLWLVSLVVAAGVSHWASSRPAPPELRQPRAPAAAAASLPGPVPAASASASPSPSLLERASRGDLESIKRLEVGATGERTRKAALAIAAGRRILLLEDVRHFGHEIARHPKMSEDPAVLARLHGYAADPQAAPEAIPIMAELPGSVGADMLYDIWKNGDHPATSSLAEDFLSSRRLARDKASSALDVLLKLEANTHCPQIHALLPKVQEHADRRAKRRLDELDRKDGCGRRHDKDCFPCLRDDDALSEARDEALQRDPPRPWVIRRR